MEKNDSIWEKFALRYKSHPWHGVDIGPDAPEELMTFIEITPNDSVKYEIDKTSGFLKVDRPQKFSNLVPSLYGFVPQTYCDKEVAAYCMERSGREGIVGDHDPLDICVLTERNITHGDILVPAIPIGGFRMIDGGEADDKIVAVLRGDEVYEKWKDITDCPESIIRRLHHYFLTYKNMPGDRNAEVDIDAIYGREEALEVIRRSQLDYQTNYGSLTGDLTKAAYKLMLSR